MPSAAVVTPVLRRDTHAVVVLVRGHAEVARWPLVGDSPPDLSVVDEVARLQLLARQVGCWIRLRDMGAELWELLDLVGLRVEVGGEPKSGEQRGVEEVVMPHDPVA